MVKKVLITGALVVLFVCDITNHIEREAVTEIQPVAMWEKIPAKAAENKETDKTPREFSQRDAQILMRVAMAEAESEHCEGMKKVMEVVLNRVNSPKYPNTIEEVVFYPNAFSSVSNGRYNRVEIAEAAHEALARIESGEPIDTEIVAFEANDGNNSLLKYFDYKYTIGRHNFYVEKGGDNG